jgi:hypothetical protein
MFSPSPDGIPTIFTLMSGLTIYYQVPGPEITDSPSVDWSRTNLFTIYEQDSRPEIHNILTSCKQVSGPGRMYTHHLQTGLWTRKRVEAKSSLVQTLEKELEKMFYQDIDRMRGGIFSNYSLLSTWSDLI